METEDEIIRARVYGPGSEFQLDDFQRTMNRHRVLEAQTAKQVQEFTELLERKGSFRRLTEAYWLGDLSMSEELLLEACVKHEELVGFKPIPGQ